MNTKFQKGNIPWNKGFTFKDIIEATDGLKVGFMDPAIMSNSNISNSSEIKKSAKELNNIIKQYLTTDKKLSKDSINSITSLKDKLSDLNKKIEKLTNSKDKDKLIAAQSNATLGYMNAENAINKILNNINEGNTNKNDNISELENITGNLNEIVNRLNDVGKIASNMKDVADISVNIKDAATNIKDTQKIIDEKNKQKKKAEEKLNEEKTKKLLEQFGLGFEPIIGKLPTSKFDIENIASGISSKTLMETINKEFSGDKRKKIKGINDIFDSMFSLAKHTLNNLDNFKGVNPRALESQIDGYMYSVSEIIDKLNNIYAVTKTVKSKQSLENVKKLQEYIENLISTITLGEKVIKGVPLDKKFIDDVIENIHEGNISKTESIYQSMLDNITQINNLEKEFREKSKGLSGDFSNNFNEVIFSQIQNAFDEYEGKRLDVTSIQENKGNFLDLLDKIDALKSLAKDNLDLSKSEKDFLNKQLPEVIKTLKKSQKSTGAGLAGFAGGVLNKIVDITDIPLFSMMVKGISKVFEEDSYINQQRKTKLGLLKNIGPFDENSKKYEEEMSDNITAIKQNTADISNKQDDSLKNDKKQNSLLMLFSKDSIIRETIAATAALVLLDIAMIKKSINLVKELWDKKETLKEMKDQETKDLYNIDLETIAFQEQNNPELVEQARNNLEKQKEDIEKRKNDLMAISGGILPGNALSDFEKSVLQYGEDPIITAKLISGQMGKIIRDNLSNTNINPSTSNFLSDVLFPNMTNGIQDIINGGNNLQNNLSGLNSQTIVVPVPASSSNNNSSPVVVQSEETFESEHAGIYLMSKGIL